MTKARSSKPEINEFKITIDSSQALATLETVFQVKPKRPLGEVMENLRLMVFSLIESGSEQFPQERVLRIENGKKRQKVIDSIRRGLKGLLSVRQKGDHNGILITHSRPINYVQQTIAVPLAECLASRSNLITVWKEGAVIHATARGETTKKFPSDLLEQIQWYMKDKKPGQQVMVMIDSGGAVSFREIPVGELGVLEDTGVPTHIYGPDSGPDSSDELSDEDDSDFD